MTEDLSSYNSRQLAAIQLAPRVLILISLPTADIETLGNLYLLVTSNRLQNYQLCSSVTCRNSTLIHSELFKYQPIYATCLAASVV